MGIFYEDKGRIMEQNVITFTGKNEQLFSKHQIEALTPKLTLIVPETHNAILIKDGQMLQTLSSGKFLISKFIDIKEEADASLAVLFMSKTAKLKLLWGTAQKFLMYDSNLQENYKVGMSGDFDVQIGDPRKCYLYLVGADDDLTSEALQERLMSNVVATVESVVAEYLSDNKIMFNQVTVYKRDISAKVVKSLNQKLMSEYGIAVFSFNISNVLIDDEDYNRLAKLHRGGKIEEEKPQPKEEPVEVAEKPAKAEKTIFCDECGISLSATAKFCWNCGKKVGGTRKCPECANEIGPEAKFCANCGHKL